MMIHIKRVLVIKISLLFVFFVLSSCNNYTKDDYLKKYESFVFDIKRDWKNFSDSDWQKNSIKNNNFYENDYKKFSSELSASELIRVNRFNFVFHFYKGDITLKSLLSGDYNEVFKGSVSELYEIIRELKLTFSDFESERITVIINKLLE